MEHMEKYSEPQQQLFPYKDEEIRTYMTDVRLQITDSEGTLDDQEALEKIENYVFSLSILPSFSALSKNADTSHTKGAIISRYSCRVFNSSAGSIMGL